MPFAVIFLAALAAWWVGRGRLGRREALLCVLGMGAIFRLTLLPAAPGLSDAVDRALWDGRVQHAGVNPYAHAPDDPELSPLRDPAWERIERRGTPAIQPPGLQMLFAATYAVTPHPMGFRLLVIGFDLGILGLLAGLALRLEVDAWNLVLYAWSPLPLLEVAASGHGDVIAVFLLLLALALALRRGSLGSSLAYGGAILAKVFPLVLLPTFLRRTPALRLWPLPLILLLGVLPYRSAGSGVFHGLSAHAHGGQHNDALFRWVLRVVEWLEPTQAVEGAVTWVRGLFGATGPGLLQPYAQPAALARVGVAVGVLAVATAVSFRPWRPTREALVALAALTLLAPVVPPWSLLWFAPLLVLHPSRGLLLWTALVPLSYLLGSGEGAADGWILALEYVPVAGVLALEAWRGRGRGTPAPGRFP